jgi:hypothetical protein
MQAGKAPPGKDLNVKEMSTCARCGRRTFKAERNWVRNHFNTALRASGLFAEEEEDVSALLRFV